MAMQNRVMTNSGRHMFPATHASILLGRRVPMPLLANTAQTHAEVLSSQVGAARSTARSQVGDRAMPFADLGDGDISSVMHNGPIHPADPNIASAAGAVARRRE